LQERLFDATGGGELLRVANLTQDQLESTAKPLYSAHAPQLLEACANNKKESAARCTLSA